MSDSIKIGSELGQEMLIFVKAMEPDEHAEKIKYWGGLLGSLIGAATASIGSDVSAALIQVIEPMAANLAKEKAN